VLDYYNSGITVSTVNLIDVQVPEAVAASQRDANKAQADKERFVLEAEAYSNSILPVAEGAAARIAQDALAYKSQVTAAAEGRTARFAQLEASYSQAPEITRRRMYMDTVEAVLARAHKVLIDTHAGNNLIYLPIDKILEKSVNREVEQTPEATTGGQKEDQVTIEARSRGER
jgi:membrane protease subunit HflK